MAAQKNTHLSDNWMVGVREGGKRRNFSFIWVGSEPFTGFRSFKKAKEFDVSKGN
jgi:hypothetical protein